MWESSLTCSFVIVILNLEVLCCEVCCTVDSTPYLDIINNIHCNQAFLIWLVLSLSFPIGRWLY